MVRFGGAAALSPATTTTAELKLSIAELEVGGVRKRQAADAGELPSRDKSRCRVALTTSHYPGAAVRAAQGIPAEEQRHVLNGRELADDALP